VALQGFEEFIRLTIQSKTSWYYDDVAILIRSENQFGDQMECRQEVELRDSNAKLIAIADRDMVFRFLKHHCPDGDYTVVGPGIDIVCQRLNGVVYPSAGVIDGERLPPRSDNECQNAPEFKEEGMA
jgi:hypothetical protein